MRSWSVSSVRRVLESQELSALCLAGAANISLPPSLQFTFQTAGSLSKPDAHSASHNGCVLRPFPFQAVVQSCYPPVRGAFKALCKQCTGTSKMALQTGLISWGGFICPS